MGDHITETVEQFEKRCHESYARDQFLGSDYLDLNEKSISWILNHIDCFVSQSRGNTVVENVGFYLYSVDRHDDHVWDKVGQAIGNLQALKTIYISNQNSHEEDSSDEDDDDEELVPPVPMPMPDWEIMARILKHVRQNVAVVIDDESPFTIEEVQPFARAIYGHPTITSFKESGMFPYESLETLFSTLQTLPALDSVCFGAPDVRQVDESTLAHPESLTELLRVPTLRFVCFNNFSFTPALFQSTASALMEGTAITKLEFSYCSFPAVECNAMMVNGLSRDSSVISIIAHQCNNAQALFDALVAALPLNSTLRHLELGRQNNDGGQDVCPYLPPFFSALGQNTGLKTLKANVRRSTEESLRTAINDGLRMNKTLESLDLDDVPLFDDDADSWCRAFSFLRTNKTLKSLWVGLDFDTTESCLSAFRSNIACMLQDNTSLESLSIHSWSIKIKAEQYVALITLLQHNGTLKTFSLNRFASIRLNDDESKQMALLLKKNYALESLPDIALEYHTEDVVAILRLNAAGRRYLVQDGSSISKGVEVLSRVSYNINFVFLHLLENPRLCDRSAVEMVTDAGESNDRSTSASSSGEKPE
jgi:hypothetical protein